MSATDTSQDVASMVGSLSKDQAKAMLIGFDGTIKLDFTEEFIDGLPEDRLKHILMAAITTCAAKH